MAHDASGSAGRGSRTRSPLPVLTGDSSLAFLAEGYRFGARRFEKLGSDAFRTRLAGRRITVLRGAEAARFFYEGDRFTRTGAMPPSALHSLQDEGSVQTLDGAAHRQRKRMFVETLVDADRSALIAAYAQEWDRQLAAAWGRRIVLLRTVSSVLTRAACRWAGVPLGEGDVEPRSREFRAMIDGAGSLGPRNWRGRALRLRTEAWARERIREARRGLASGAPDSILARIARQRDSEGHLLDERTAGVELLNVLRPTVAVARFIVFAALALHLHPEWARRFAAGDDSDLRGFAEEVRRCTPFFPAIAGIATRDLEWQGAPLPTGSWVLLDLFATNRDPRLWPEPLEFRPERFRDPAAAHYLVPQGAGGYEDGHRCPGEPATVDLVEEAVRALARTDYRVPDQDLGVDLRRLPARPASGFVMEAVRLREPF